MVGDGVDVNVGLGVSVGMGVTVTSTKTYIGIFLRSVLISTCFWSIETEKLLQ
jgi:hypothetical protein